jgi:hypothetical protein
MLRARLICAGLAVMVAAVVACGQPEAARAGSYFVKYENDNGGAGCGLFSANVTPGYSATCSASAMTIAQTGLTVPGGSEENFSANAPAGLMITDAQSTYSTAEAGTGGWGSGDFYTAGGNSWNPGASADPLTDPPFTSSSWGFQLLCSSAVSQCSRPLGGDPPTPGPFASVVVTGVTLTVSESQAPSLAPFGPANLANQTAGYAWNPPGDPWSIATAGSDPSGVCTIVATVNGDQLTPLVNTQGVEYQWQECPNQTWPGTVDTRQFVAGDGPLSLTLTGINAAGNKGSISRTIQVDNDPVQESLSTPNDPNPTLWVNHPVTVQSAASAGPSGITGTSCDVDGGASSPYPTGGLSVDGDGSHTVSCTSSNGAVDPQGDHNTGTASLTIKIDEAPPAVGFEPVNPSDPTAVVVDTSDAESGVAGGSITVQGPHAKAPRPLKTALDGSQLVSRFDDAGKHGVFTFVGTACDAVGNCASSTEALRFPIRLGSRSYLSFHAIKPPAKVVRARVRVGFRTRTVVRHRHGKRVRETIKVGGHVRRVTVHVNQTTGCGVARVKVHRRDYQDVRVCRRLTPRVVTHHRQRLGRKVSVHGLVTTKQGRPLAHVKVAIATKLTDRGARFRRALATRTDSNGVWSAKLAGGPSRTIRARYVGSRTVEPATSLATLSVPAEIRLRISPHVVPWSRRIEIRGHLVGRYVPHDGVALRLLVRYSEHGPLTPLEALRTTRHGAFAFAWSYHSGRGVATYPFSVATTATETDYPYAAGRSKPVRVTFGRNTPHRAHKKSKHHHEHRRRRGR